MLKIYFTSKINANILLRILTSAHKPSLWFGVSRKFVTIKKTLSPLIKINKNGKKECLLDREI